ncbi:DUF3363 domain-containing protein [Caulobacter sp. SSI4214]|uniref:relaxase/mobilization nuclease domain-containing protein n=1 Tax=Caulobacter sp. SSI4214 TaxID=2575739 RepID=UPI001439F96E|nr:DUF3363 domain-containing protein [Caulobacter sp. SSI4214]
MSGEDDFRPRLGRIGDRGGKERGFVGEVLRAARRSGQGALDLGGRSGRGRLGRGRAALMGGPSSGRKVVIKARIVQHRGARYRAAPLATHLRYLRREGVSRDGALGEMFDRDGAADPDAFAGRCEDDRHHFRFIVSPEDAGQLADVRATTRDLMAQAERDLGTRLDWVAVDHWNTDNPHVHVLVRGAADDGGDLVIDRDYIARGLRARAEQLVSLELGPRSQKEIEAGLDREVAAHRWTSLDRALRERAEGPDGHVDLRGQGHHQNHHRRLVGRAQVLERLGLVQADGPGRWTLAPDLEARLRALAERGDIIKTLHRVMGPGRDPTAIALDGGAPAWPVFGRLVERGLHDELNGQAYAIVDGVDGRLHHVRFQDLAETGDTPIGGLVEVRTRLVEGARPRAELVHRSDLGLDAQVGAQGATWLDRQMVAREPQDLAASGFGQEVRVALGKRRARLEAMGLARMGAGRTVLSKDLIATLRARELARVSDNLRAETGAARIEGGTGDRVEGVYRRRLDLVSGRFAMIEDGLGFQLVPWTRGLDQHLGQPVRGVLTPGGGVDWTLGRKRGLGR